jgi:hypothetical protein
MSGQTYLWIDEGAGRQRREIQFRLNGTWVSRDDLLLALASADGQNWSSIKDATRHTIEIMYGPQANAVIQLLESQC